MKKKMATKLTFWDYKKPEIVVDVDLSIISVMV